jgi:hypothetical protein
MILMINFTNESIISAKRLYCLNSAGDNLGKGISSAGSG